MMERIRYEGQLIALIIPNEHSEPGFQVCTEDDFSQQLAFMRYPVNQVIGALGRYSWMSIRISGTWISRPWSRSSQNGYLPSWRCTPAVCPLPWAGCWR
jgi:hypothetical protein